MFLQQNNMVTLPSINQRSSSETPNAPVGGYLSLQDIVLKEPVRAMNMNAQQKKRAVNGTASPEAYVPDVHSFNWSLR